MHPASRGHVTIQEQRRSPPSSWYRYVTTCVCEGGRSSPRWASRGATDNSRSVDYLYKNKMRAGRPGRHPTQQYSNCSFGAATASQVFTPVVGRCPHDLLAGRSAVAIKPVRGKCGINSLARNKMGPRLSRSCQMRVGVNYDDGPPRSLWVCLTAIILWAAARAARAGKALLFQRVENRYTRGRRYKGGSEAELRGLLRRLAAVIVSFLFAVVKLQPGQLGCWPLLGLAPFGVSDGESEG